MAASGSGKNPDDNQTKEPVESEESNAAAAAAPATAEPPPPVPPSDRLHGSPEAGDRSPSAATAAEAAAAAQRKGKGIAGAAPSWRHDTGGTPPLSPWAACASRESEPKSAAGKPPLPPRASKSEGKKPMSHAAVVRSGMEVRNKWKDMREGRMHMKEVFEELLEEANAEMDQKDEPEGAAMQQEQTIPMIDEMVAGPRAVECNSNAPNLRHTYSRFRLVRGDGECFYRSFIFSHLGEVLDRQDTHEEHRLLVAVKEVARQHVRLGWAFEYSRNYIGEALIRLARRCRRLRSVPRRQMVMLALLVALCCLPTLAAGYQRVSQDEIAAFLGEMQHNQLVGVQEVENPGFQDWELINLPGWWAIEIEHILYAWDWIRPWLVPVFVALFAIAYQIGPEPVPGPRLLPLQEPEAVAVVLERPQITHPIVYLVMLVISAAVSVIGFGAFYLYGDSW